MTYFSRRIVCFIGGACVAIFPFVLSGCAGDDDHDLDHRYQYQRRGGSHEHPPHEYHHDNRDHDQ